MFSILTFLEWVVFVEDLSGNEGLIPDLLVGEVQDAGCHCNCSYMHLRSAGHTQSRWCQHCRPHAVVVPSLQLQAAVHSLSMQHHDAEQELRLVKIAACSSVTSRVSG
jgi:RES domain-containing protein